MLVLSRKTEETILIGTDIVVTVLEVKGNRVRLGIQAPTNCTIVRGELNTNVALAAVPAVAH